MTFPREIELAFDSNIACIWEDFPGVGKTRSLEAFLKERNTFYVELIASIREPSDFGGMPLLNAQEGTYRLAPPVWVKSLLDHAKLGQRTCVFVDELTTAAPAVQAAVLRLFEDRVCGEMELPDDCFMLAACNPPEIASNGFELSAPLANRFMHIKPTFDPRSFVMNFPTYFMTDKGGGPPTLPGIDERKWLEERGRIAAFLHTRPAQVLAFPKEESKRSKAWPSPRTWDKASRILAVAHNIDDGLQGVAGCVGEGVALEVANFLRHLDLPNPEDLLKDPTKFDMKKYKGRGDMTFAILSSVHAAITFKNDAKRYQAAWKIIGTVADAGLQDVGACWARPFSRLLPKGTMPPPEVMKFNKILTEAGVRYSGS